AHVNAAHDVDVAHNDSKNGNDRALIMLATVNLFTPRTSFYHYVFPTGFNPVLGADSGPLASCGGVCGSGSGRYRTHFRPDVADATLMRILRAFGTVTSKVDSTYEFPAGRAGD